MGLRAEPRRARAGDRDMRFKLRVLILVLMALAASGNPVDDGEAAAADYHPPITYDIPYTESAGSEGEKPQTLDLYLPAGTKTKPPLLVFVHDGFWTSSHDKRRIGPSLASNLRTNGVAVALIHYRQASNGRHPAPAQHVADAMAYLARRADTYGYDSRRIYLAGHSAGAHLAALVALDPSYLASHRLHPRSLAGVIAVSGIYNLEPEVDIAQSQRAVMEQVFDKASLKSASPLTHARGDAPPFLILSAGEELPGLSVQARKFAAALRAKGHRHVRQLVVAGSDHFSIVRLWGEDDLTRRLLLAFLKVEKLPRLLAEWLQARQEWIEPPFSTLPFWRYANLVRSYPIDQRFVDMLGFAYRENAQELFQWPLGQYHAIELFAYLDSLPKAEVGEGPYLTLTNIRGEKQFWTREEIEPYKPVIVVGLDDERNLFRLSGFYRMLRQYSWKPGGPSPFLTLSLGAFIYFQSEPPERLRAQSWHYGLTPKSFRLTRSDPVASLRDLPKEIYETLTYRNGCVYCHTFRAVGSRSHHVLSKNGAPHGGFALPLEDYPPQVWKDFIFHQEAVAEKMGATPNMVTESARQPLYNLVVQGRSKAKKPASSTPPR